MILRFLKNYFTIIQPKHQADFINCIALINVICICYQTKTVRVFGDNIIGFIIRSKIRIALNPMKGLQYGDISQKVGYWLIRLELSE